MLRTACYRHAKNYPGEKYAISRTQPAGCSYPSIPYLYPSWAMVMGLKQGEITQEQYRELYLQMLEAPCSCRRSQQEPHPVRQHLEAIKAEVEKGRDIVLLCWEPPGQFCHRVLVAEYLVNNLGLDPALVEIN